MPTAGKYIKILIAQEGKGEINSILISKQTHLNISDFDFSRSQGK
jgi:hypothetical protein